jgi:hypothetical protein
LFLALVRIVGVRTLGWQSGKPRRSGHVTSNIGLFDRIANPLIANDESGSNSWNQKKPFHFNILPDSQLAEQQQHDQHH